MLSNEVHITVKEITDKVTNVKHVWKEAREMQQHAGWGIEGKDDASINELLERNTNSFGF